MRKFILKFLIFISIPAIYFGINLLINYYNYHHQQLPIEKTEVLIAGDSRIQRSIDPQFFHSAQNIAQTAEPYYITYWKLQKIYESFIPDTLILSLSPASISKFNDVKFSHPNWSAEMFRRTYSISNFRNLDPEIKVDYGQFIRTYFQENALYPRWDHFGYISQYQPMNGIDVSNWEEASLRHYYDHNPTLSYSQTSINYLDSIIQYSQLRNVEIILTDSPVYTKYLERIPKTILKKHSELIRKYKKNIMVFDQTYAQYPDSLFIDADHLNHQGAEKFTKELTEYIKAQNLRSL